MKQYIFNTAIAILLLVTGSASVAAQNIRTAYFMDNATHRHHLNPAYQTPTGYVSVPMLGSVQANFNTNTLNVKNIFSPYQGELVTFLHSSVDGSQFLNKMRDINHINMDMNLSVLSTGFYTKVGYFTFDIGAKVYGGGVIPKEFLKFAKMGMTDENGQTYHFKNLDIDASAYTDIAFGYSRKLDDRLTVGGKFKILLGFADTKIHYSDVVATLNEDKWTMTTTGTADVVATGVSPKYSDDAFDKIDGIDYSSGFGVNGIGAGIDMGATFKSVDLFDGKVGEIFDNFTFSAALLDLGFISWNSKNAVKGVADGETFEFSGLDLDFFDDDSDIPSMGDQLSDVGDELKEIFYFSEQTPSSRARMLRATLNLGAEYSFFEDKLGVGLLSSTRFGAPHTWSELTLSGNYQPFDWLGVTLSYSFIHSSFQTFGWALNLSPSWINFFIGADYMVTKVAKPFVPMTNAMNVNFGISVPLSKNKASN